MTTTRLNKHIAETGYCSRREADRLISSRRVTVNGSVAGVAAVVGEDDEVRVDGQRCARAWPPSPVRAGMSTSR
jgi:23S rRNA pseudouridine2604 synthase